MQKEHADPFSAAAETTLLHENDLAKMVESALTGRALRLLKLKRQDIDAEANLSEYGFDSISFTELTNRINRAYALELLPTIFFECPTLGALAAYLVKNHAEDLIGHFSLQQNVAHDAAYFPEAMKPLNRGRNFEGFEKQAEVRRHHRDERPVSHGL